VPGAEFGRPLAEPPELRTVVRTLIAVALADPCLSLLHPKRTNQ
jgi:hypothetical protein